MSLSRISEWESIGTRIWKLRVSCTNDALSLLSATISISSTGDTGAGATLNPYLTRIAAVGPEMGVLFPVGEMQGSLSLRGYWEFAAQNRSSGWNTWLAFSITPPWEKTPKIVK